MSQSSVNQGYIDLKRIKDKNTSGYRIMLFTVFLVYASAMYTQVTKSNSQQEIHNSQNLKKTKEVFRKVDEIQLETNEKCVIEMITDFGIDRNYNYIIADGWNSKDVFIFSKKGAFLRSLGKTGQGPGEYISPVSISISMNGDIWVADYLSNRVTIFDDAYKFKHTILCKPRVQYYIHINSKDELYSYSGSSFGQRKNFLNTIHKYDQYGKEIISFASFPKEALKINFSAIQDGMIIDSKDFVYEMNPLYYKIRKYSPDGKLLKTFSRKTDLFRVIPARNGNKPIIVNGPFYLKKNFILAQVSDHLEIYNTEGKFIVGKLPFPHRIIGADNDCLYTEKWDDKEGIENLRNPKLVIYKLLDFEN